MKKLVLCACHFYHRLPSEALQTVYSTWIAAGRECEVVPDLCLIAARMPEELRRMAASDVVCACQPRVIQAFFEGLGSPRCFDLRTTSAKELLAEILPEAEIARILDDSESWEKTISETPSEWIPWFPVVDSQRCVDCRRCVDFCMFGVYAVDASNHVRVAHPDLCKTNCPACARLCPQNAIMFPKSEEASLNGSLQEKVKPSEETALSLKERLRRRKTPRLFKEDAE